MVQEALPEGNEVVNNVVKYWYSSAVIQPITHEFKVPFQTFWCKAKQCASIQSYAGILFAFSKHTS